eukprot:gnl/MRDRNA2_/MRDRNA2_46457_c0_seq1.p1 gnl/MRDRNA2_/MRDRNA2_46457_c0~~gnl/MRDRNA2_/MRDRNA2_46457_c0_seq1.p1  ORF type:complete len:553 (+),score=95.82 gnl/MRDRNA2_/MRDRNA2_46457_c0_seq1:86-1744(+)
MSYSNPSDPSVPWPEDVEWVKRNPKMWIHGKTNLETPPDILDTAGFHTPSDLFFVRQHSAVPRCVAPGSNPDDHEFFIEQLMHDESGQKKVLKTVTMTLGQLKQEFTKVTISSMLSCSGQRRYEMNMVEKTGGAISWHNSVGNATWGGVYLHEILSRFGVSMDLKLSKYVEFAGKEGYKGCVPFRKAMDPFGECLICWEMNGEPLHPDHGQPLRAMIPGYSSKCSTKWLTGISVRDKDCEHGKHVAYYKLFPTSLKPGNDEYKNHHKDPEYTIGELNVNSVIFEPHSCTRVGPAGPLRVTGYAHTGGGRPLSRVEVSGNGGQSWEQVRPLKQELNEAGQLWNWVRWEHVLRNFDPSAEDAQIVCRAWDCAGNTQPDLPIWNYTGMLNNHLYRVKVLPSVDGEPLFIHPAQWMNPKLAHKPAEEDKLTPITGKAAMAKSLQGKWRIGNFMDSLVNLTVDHATEKVASDEARWAGQKFQGKVLQSSDGLFELHAEFFSFSVKGEVLVSELCTKIFIKWSNGMSWEKVDNVDITEFASSDVEAVLQKSERHTDKA